MELRLAPTSITVDSQSTRWGRMQGIVVFPVAIGGTPSPPSAQCILLPQDGDGMDYSHHAFDKSSDVFIFAVHQRS